VSANRVNSSCTFRRTRDGVTSFARVTVSTRENVAWTVDWSDDARPLRDVYGAEMEAAIEKAASALRARGGAPSAVRIDAIVETLADTKPDAVACAAAIAAWKAWYCDESKAIVEVDGAGKWSVTFAV
jgi:hypothetical protein